MKKIIIIALLLITSSMSAQTGMDSIMFNEINRLRANPKSYIPLIKEYIELNERTLKSIKEGKHRVTGISGAMTTRNGIKNKKISSGSDVIVRNIHAAKELIIELKKIKKLEPLIFDTSMDSITDSHGEYLDSVNAHGHFGPNGQTLSERFKNFRLYNISENVSSVGSFVYTTKDVKPILVSLLVDGGISNRGHRKNLLNPKSKYVAIYMSRNTCVQNFGY